MFLIILTFLNIAHVKKNKLLVSGSIWKTQYLFISADSFSSDLLISVHI